MKKVVFILVLSVVMLGSSTAVRADESNNLNRIIVNIANGETIEDYLDDAYDGILSEGDDIVTKSAIEDGIKYAQQMSDSKTRRSGEIWTVTGTDTVRSYGSIGTKFLKKIAAGQTKSHSVSASFSFSGKLEDFTLGVGTSFSKSESFSGPNGTEKVGKDFATHRFVNAIARGTITEYTVRITDKYTGQYIRTHKYNAVTNHNIDLYGNLVSIAAEGEINVRSATNSKTWKYKSEESYKSKYHGLNKPSYIAW